MYSTFQEMEYIRCYLVLYYIRKKQTNRIKILKQANVIISYIEETKKVFLSCLLKCWSCHCSLQTNKNLPPPDLFCTSSLPCVHISERHNNFRMEEEI